MKLLRKSIDLIVILGWAWLITGAGRSSLNFSCSVSIVQSEKKVLCLHLTGLGKFHLLVHNMGADSEKERGSLTGYIIRLRQKKLTLSLREICETLPIK